MIDSHTSLAEKFLRKGFWLYLFSFIIAPMGYVVKILISGEISVSELGILYGVISLITLLSAFSDLWVGESLKYFIPKYVEQKQYRKIKSILAYGLIIQIFSGFILAGIFLFGADFLANHYFKDSHAAWVIKIFSLFFLGINIFQIISQFLLAVQDTFYYKISELVRHSSILFTTLVIIFFDMSHLQNLSYVWIIWLYGWLLFSIILFYKKYYLQYLQNITIIWSRKLLKKFMGYAGLVFISAQAGMLLSQIDMQMIIYLLSTQDAWYYSIYLSLIMIPFLLVWPILALLLPVFSQLSSQKSYNNIVKTKKVFTQSCIAIWIFFSIFIYIYAQNITYLLFWNTFLTSAIILQYSCMFLVFNFLLQINFSILWWMWRLKDKLCIILIALWLNIWLNIYLIWFFWVAWAALATWIGWLAIWLMWEYVLWRSFRWLPHIIFFIKTVISVSVIATISYLLWGYSIEDTSRMQNLLFLLWIWSIWILFFVFTYKWEFKNMIAEIKKIRWK